MVVFDEGLFLYNVLTFSLIFKIFYLVLTILGKNDVWYIVNYIVDTCILCALTRASIVRESLQNTVYYTGESVEINTDIPTYSANIRASAGG